MTGKRTYGDGCGIAHGLDVVGERWALLVVRELLLGPKRFTDLRSGLPNASPNVLSQRLRELETAGVIQRRRLAPPAGSSVYELTEWGRGLEPIVMAFGGWAIQSPAFPPGDPIGEDSVILALRTLFDAEAAAGVSARYEVRLGEQRFRVAVDDGEISTSRGGVEDPDAVIEADPPTLAAVLDGRRPLDDALDAGDLRVDRGKAAARRFAGLFG